MDSWRVDAVEDERFNAFSMDALVMGFQHACSGDQTQSKAKVNTIVVSACMLSCSALNEARTQGTQVDVPPKTVISVERMPV